jgi:apoptosis-inducing factor 3
MANSGSSGPDLEMGLELSQLPEGRMVVGMFRATRILLVNYRGRYYALSAMCTYMSAPLVDGLIVDGTVRCPWHHARFSLDSGEAIAAPAFDPLTLFETSVVGDQVFVTKRLELAPKRPAHSGGPRVVIIGSGAGGYACAELLARSGLGRSVTVVTDDTDVPYDRTVCSKQYLIGMQSRQDGELPQSAFQQQGSVAGAALRVGCRAQSIDLSGRTIQLNSGQSLAFDVLVLATGGEPKLPQLPGFDHAKVYRLRTLKDADAIIAASRHARRVAVLGSSFVGLEAAASLRQRKLDVTVISPEDIPLEKFFGAEVGRLIQHVHEEQGVTFRLRRQARSFDGARLILDDGSSVEADFIVVGVGVVPRTELALAAGIKCACADDGDGIEVNERLETSAPRVFAIGDVARYPDPFSGERIRVEHWVHAQRQGQHVARVILGQADSYDALPFFWSAHFDTGFRYVGHTARIADLRVNGSIAERSFTACYRGDNQQKSFVSCNRDISALQIEAAWEGEP